jgi:hypothetical protein
MKAVQPHIGFIAAYKQHNSIFAEHEFVRAEKKFG